MAGFFYDIRSFFNAKYSGRYLAFMLRELAKHDPKLFGRIFELKEKHWPTEKNGLQLECEWHFNPDDKKAFADIALLDGGQPILLVEIKEDDIVNPKNREQIERYISYSKALSKNERPKLAYVSRYAPNAELSAIIDRNSDIAFEVRYRKILKVLETNKSSVGTMVKDYLEDIGVSSYKMIDFNNDKGAMTFLLVKMLGLPHNHGHGKLASDKAINSIPVLFDKLLGNLEVMGEWLKTENHGLFSNRLTRGFMPEPHYAKSAIKEAHDGGESSTWIGNADGGCVYFYAYGGLQKENSKKGVSVEIGYSFHIGKGKEKSLRTRLYARFWWQGDSADKSVDVRSFPSEKIALKKLRDCLENALDKAKKKNNLHIDVRNALNKFKLPPTG